VKPYIFFALGVVMFFGGMWGGAYAGHEFSIEHWAHTPCVISMFVISVAGWFTAWMAGFSIMDSHKSK